MIFLEVIAELLIGLIETLFGTRRWKDMTITARIVIIILSIITLAVMVLFFITWPPKKH